MGSNHGSACFLYLFIAWTFVHVCCLCGGPLAAGGHTGLQESSYLCARDHPAA